MNNPPDPLDQLPPLALPDAIGWWPLAPGWWITALLICIVLFVIGFYASCTWRLGRIKRQCLQELQHIERRHQQQPDLYRYLHECNQLLRRFCQQQYHYSRLTKLTGELWLKELDSIAQGKYLYTEAGRQLLNLYQKRPTADGATLYPAIEQWLKRAPLKLTEPNQLHVNQELCDGA